MLQRGEVDFIVLDHRLDQANIEKIDLGHENYVVIASKNKKAASDVFLDNDAQDRSTELFFSEQQSKTKYSRSFFDDCYGIIDGVAAGFGRAVMPRHLVKNNSEIKVLTGFKAYRTEVVLHYYQQPFYTKLHLATVQALKNSSGAYL
jgi:hypothetical protein